MRSIAAVLVIMFCSLGCTTTSPLEGTWILVSRELPNGSVQHPPDVMGCLTYTEDRRNFNVYWKDDQGQPVSIGSIAEYDFTGDMYEEWNLYYMMNGMGQGVQYDLSDAHGSAEVHHVDGRLEFQLPLHDEPHVTFDGDRFTARREGVFVDHWRRID